MEAKFTPQSVDRNKPSWLVTATGSAAIGMVGDAPQDFIRILNLTPGANVSGDFTAWVRDISTTATLSLPDGQNQSAAKQKIKKRLKQLNLEGGEEGIAKLAVAGIKFAARDD